MRQLGLGIISICISLTVSATTQTFVPIFNKNIVTIVPSATSTSTPADATGGADTASSNVIYIPLRVGNSTTFIPITPATTPDPVDPPVVIPPSFPTTDLVAEYLFNDATNLGKDTSGNGHNGTLNGTFITQPGLDGNAAQFSKAQYIEIPDSDAFSVGLNGLTVSFWQRQSDSENWKGIISKSNSAQSEWYVDDAKSGTIDTLSAGLHGSAGTVTSQNTATSETGVWNHYTVVYQGKNAGDAVDIYKNGVLTTHSTTTENGIYANTTAPLTIGRSFDKASSRFHFYSGLLDNVRVYSKALLEHEVVGLYQELNAPAPSTAALQALDDYYTYGTPFPGFYGLFPLNNDQSGTPNSRIITSITPPTNGTATLYTNQVGVRYIPNNGYCGYDSFDYTTTDASNQTSTATVHIMMECGSTNTKPIANDDSAVTDRNTPITINPLTNDTDADLHPLEIFLVQPTSSGGNGTVTLNRDDSITYTPNTDYCGADSYNVHVRDNMMLESRGVATFNVTCSNLRPTPQDDYVSTTQDTSITISPLINDTDPDGDTLSFAGAFPANHGTNSNNLAAGTVTYTPEAGYCGNDYFSYDVADPHGATWFAVIHVDVACTSNKAPIAQNDDATTDAGTSVTINVLNNDSDPEGSALTLISATTPPNGTTAISGTNVIYTPNANYCGNDTFNYTVRDVENTTTVGTVSVSVACAQAPNTPVLLHWEPNAVAVGQPSTLMWEFSNVSSCQISHSSSTAIAGQEILSIYEVGTTTATFKCTDTSGTVHNFSAVLNVSKLNAPANLRQQ